ncbi:multidrug ABC transporter permease, partial [Streptomyces sp. SID2955]|nr:multidrug ABC transporter permease [Streptomyces sp. SID2955]
MSGAPAVPRTASAEDTTLLLTPPVPRPGWRLLPARVVA